MAEIIQFNGKKALPAVTEEEDEPGEMVRAWTCACGCQLYVIMSDGVMCSTCEKITSYPELFGADDD